MRLIHLIRHARPAVTGVLLGGSDIPLASEELTASTLVVDRVLASPLARAWRTAELLFPGTEITAVPEFAERGLGQWERKRWDEVEAEWPELAGRASVDWFGTTPPGGEPWSDFVARVERGWRGVPPAGAIAIVAHVGVNSVLAHLADGRELASFQQDYLEVISIALSD
ncbi:MAG: histidine phosphatase family protein [Bryobacteraceae bacterium]